MKNKTIIKKYVALTTALSCLTMTGCSSFVSDDVTKYELVSQLSEQEIIDYYAKALDYDSVVKRAADDNKEIVTYNVNPVSPNKEDRLKRLVSKAEQILSSDKYSYENDNSDIVSEDTWVYIKSLIDNEVLSNGSIVDIGGALGFYFVDVQYDISASTPGSFKEYADMLGLNGVFMETSTGNYRVNVNYLKYAMDAMNNYFMENNIMKCAYYDEGTLTFKIIDGLDPTTYTNKSIITEDDYGLISNVAQDTPSEDLTTSDEAQEGVEGEQQAEEVSQTVEGEQQVEEASQTVEDEQQAEDSEAQTESIPETLPTVQPGESVQQAIVSYESFVDESRRPALDSDLINSVVGSSNNNMAFLPYLDLVYETNKSNGLSGLGIYPQANSGLKLFGYDRAETKGTVTLRYVFKDDINATGKFIGTNIYIMSEEVVNGASNSKEQLVLPEYLKKELEILIERADRVQANVDLAGMMSGNIYEDKGVAVLAAFKNSGAHTGKYMSTIRQIIGRDMEHNSYLLDVETTVIDGPRSSNCYGTYKDRAYVVVQQQGNKFVISDYSRQSRKMVEEPPIDPDKAIEKRLVALNLAGEVEDTEKNACKTLMSELYTASTNRQLNAYEIDGEQMRGMLDCFNSNTEMLSKAANDYMNSMLRGKLTMFGTKTDSVMTGNITDFIGGWDNQVEFTAEELITFAGRNEGYLMTTYYLVSCMEDIWVIDERTVIEENIIEGADLEQARERLGQ